MAYRLNLQKTTTQDALEMEVDGSGLSCPGSSVVSEINSSEVTEGEGLGLGQDFSQVSQFVLSLRCNSA